MKISIQPKILFRQIFFCLFLFPLIYPLLAISNEDRILVENLTTLIFSSSFQEKIDPRTTGIHIEKVKIPDKQRFIHKMEKYLDQPISFKKLNEIRDKVILYYRKRGFPLVAVSMPTGQDITDGVVQYVIIVARLGQTQARGARYFSNRKLAKKIRTKPQEEIKRDKMVEDLRWINDNPFRSVNLVYEEGANFGETDVVLETEDRFPLRIFGSYENTGNNIAGDDRWIGGINWGNVLNLDHQVSWQFVSANHSRKWWGQAINYIAPFCWRHTLKIYGAYVKSKPSIDQRADIRGKSWEVTGRYVIPFTYRQIRQNVILGYDFKNTNNFLAFSEELVFDEYVDISQFILEYSGVVEDRYGVTSWGFEIYLSPGDMTKNNTNKEFEKQRGGSKSSYIYEKISVDRATKLYKNFTWIFKVLFQLASGKLLPTEQLSLGGAYTIRGYSENEVIGDNGLILNNEIRTPSFPLFWRGSKKDDLQLLFFCDWGWVNDVDQNILKKESTILASIGSGCRYKFKDYVTIRVDYGWQLKGINRNVGGDKCSRMHLGVAAYF